ncbi:hypothetical protein XELAEV_18011395mg [Xenopus laevis]|uniref:Uncharacterized protein n=1 Tax=Xenopus laevis TaxID=8355 RepID=A0A974DKL9_XENLA|nr:hypothetical protein XELAEV_18011395mg [Xenopus laevis]
MDPRLLKSSNRHRSAHTQNKLDTYIYNKSTDSFTPVMQANTIRVTYFQRHSLHFSIAALSSSVSTIAPFDMASLPPPLNQGSHCRLFQ